MDIDKTRTIAFTGHRQLKSGITPDELVKKLDSAIADSYRQGYRMFISGMAQGFDMLAAEAVLRFQQSCMDINLICILPFNGPERRFSYEDKQRYHSILSSTSQIHYTAEKYYDGCFLHRDDVMVSNASGIIAYYDNSVRSGTGYTVRRAQRSNLSVTNLY